ncbi:DegV family protein [Halalkalibacter nanhaiisediminis]|uniref:DegV family protein with EDD domain n=1 Tax=Halalkalibacter nanhaiisediminis TaxID=688079 RepID=A0A562QSZ0_9BACI|nr:DegV family protein [Halalkalibacter nanhaiisediminis]TWI59206.1 DegV family protein with EDD domain [Halalkalibacter nanhaiisediminis]
MTVKIVTDSTCDLSDELIDQYGITVVPLSIAFKDKTYVDGIDITKKEFIKLLTSADELPKSSQPSVGTFEKTYRELLNDPETTHVLSIHMTEGMSGTVNAARTAADMVGEGVTVVNSRFISAALSFQVIEAATMAKKGHSVNEIVERLNVIREHTSLYLMVDTLEYLAKGGRIGRGKALLGSLLKIKPIASLADGVYTPVTKVRTHMQMIDYFKRRFIEETEGKAVKAVGIAQIEAEELANKLKEALLQVREIPFITITETSPIISTHTGPGALALMYYVEEV